MTAPESQPPAGKPALIGLTGSIAAGKSAGLTALQNLGATTLSADDVVHELLATDQVRDRIVEEWGADVAPGGKIDRSRVGAIVFDNPKKLAWLESYLHPLVLERVAEWWTNLEGRGIEVAVVEIPLLFETGTDSLFDATIAIVADDDRRYERAGLRGTTLIDGRATRQFSQQEKAERADFVVANDGTLEELEEALRQTWPQLTAAAGRA